MEKAFYTRQVIMYYKGWKRYNVGKGGGKLESLYTKQEQARGLDGWEISERGEGDIYELWLSGFLTSRFLLILGFLLVSIFLLRSTGIFFSGL